MDKQIERAGDDNKNNIGVLYGIGVGPGDPELMTLKAINTIKACDISALFYIQIYINIRFTILL